MLHLRRLEKHSCVSISLYDSLSSRCRASRILSIKMLKVPLALVAVNPKVIWYRIGNIRTTTTQQTKAASATITRTIKLRWSRGRFSTRPWCMKNLRRFSSSLMIIPWVNPIKIANPILYNNNTPPTSYSQTWKASWRNIRSPQTTPCLNWRHQLTSSTSSGAHALTCSSSWRPSLIMKFKLSWDNFM